LHAPLFGARDMSEQLGGTCVIFSLNYFLDLNAPECLHIGMEGVCNMFFRP
jgi:hypothetical protein